MSLDTKDLILQSAIELFATKGFNASTTAEIARRAGVAEVTVFRHYKTKKDILLAVLEKFVDSFCKEIILNPVKEILEKNADKSTKEILKMMVKDRIEVVARNSDFFWIIITEMKYQPDLKERIIRELGPNIMNLMSRALGKDFGDGIFSQKNTEAAIRAFVGTTISVALFQKVLPEIFPVNKTMDESIDEAVEILLHGISPE